MKLHRFIGNFDFQKDKFEIFNSEISHQIKKVLRLKAGDRIILSDGNFGEALCQIISFDKKSAAVEVLEKFQNKNEPQIYGILYCSILKRENFELVVQKATEVGIKEIAPIIAKRTVKLQIKEERLNKIIKEAAEQSGRGIVPILRKAMDFEEAVADAEKNNLNLFFHQSGERFSCGELAKIIQMKPDYKIGLFIGPEGGWSDEEMKIISELRERNKSFKIISLGDLTLRAETAAIAASFLINQINLVY